MFSRNEINNYDDDTSTIYTCPHCSEAVKFYIRDFDKHWKTKSSNLEPKDYRGAQDDKGFLDFYCPKCNVPTTVTFALYAGGQHGEYWYTIEKVENEKAL
jgi:predicted RNA-binding Zn-ribbon protein involved in translation (DUF1610 family)